jgi:cysteinyl-tRNA synthetase
MPISFRDSLTGEAGPLERRPGRPLTMYVCGPTVYDQGHVGHARTYLYFDIIRRYLAAARVPVRHVMNITDYEDRVTVRAERLGLHWKTLARREEAKFLRDLRALHVLAPTVTPRATDFIPGMIRAIEDLERVGWVRRQDGSLIFDPDGRPGVLDGANFTIGEELAEHAVPEPGHPFPAGRPAREFLLWKPQAPPQPSWPSPWGPGAPGWHLECFVMAEKYLGVPIDLHGGGLDLIYPHHFSENEIARALRRSLFARRFLHTGFVTQLREKMSKSRGNLVSIRTALDASGPDALRWYLLTSPYNARLEWEERDLAASVELVAELQKRCARSLPRGAGGSIPAERLETLHREIVEQIEQGLGVDRALGALRRWMAEIERDPRGQLEKGALARARRSYGAIERLLGLRLIPPSRAGRGRG